MKKLTAIILAVVLIMSFTVCAFALDDYNTYSGYQIIKSVDEELDNQIKAIEEYWKSKINEMTYDDVLLFKYDTQAEGGTQKLIEHYYKTGSLLSAGVSITSEEAKELPYYKKCAADGVDITEALKTSSVFFYEHWVLKELDEDSYNEYEDLVEKDLYDIIKNNYTILKNTVSGSVQIDPLSSNLKFYLMADSKNGDFLVISDGTFELYYCCRWIGVPIGNEKQIYSPRQVLATMLKDSDWTEDANYYDYTKSAPSTGGGNFVNAAALMESVGLILGLAVVSKKKKG